ncbi:MAG: S8 family serine peptidase [Pirellula sp.]
MREFSSKNGKLKRSVSSIQTRQSLRKQLFETLESRHLLAADLFNLTAPAASVSPSSLVEKLDFARGAEVATHFYSAGDQKIGMTVAGDRLAIAMKPTVISKEFGEVIYSYRLDQTRPLLGTSFGVFSTGQEYDAELVEALVRSGLTDRVVQVFESVESGSEMVLLDEVIVDLPEGVTPEDYFSDSRFASYTRLAGTPDQYVAKIAGKFGAEALDVIAELQREERTDWVAPNFHQAWQRFFQPNDPRFANLWTMHHTGQTLPGGVAGLAGTDVSMLGAWDVKAGSNSNLIIGVLDDGVAINHPDLFLYDSLEDPFLVEDTNGNGWFGDRHGWNFVGNNSNSQPTTADDNHGTAVAGVAAARGNNGIGVVGSGYGSPVLAAKMFEGAGVATDANIASAIYYLAGRTASGTGTWNASTVVNHSWGGGAVSTAINEALTWATTQARGGLGVPQFFASGNSPGLVGNPANQSATNAGIIVVGSMNNAGELSSYHSRGALLDIVTPSNEVLPGYLAVDTTDRVGSDGYNNSSDYTDTGTFGFGGTSSASPLATGVGALALARADDLNIDISAAQLRSLMRNNTKLAGDSFYDVFNNGKSFDGGFGLLNAKTLLEGIGSAQISVTTSIAVIPNGSSGWTAGEVFTGSTTEFGLRVRNQGTSTLNLNSITLTGSSAYEIFGTTATSLALGESTVLTVRFKPMTDGVHAVAVSIASNDPNDATFTFNVSSEALPAQVSGTVFEDQNGSGTLGTGERTLTSVPILFDTNNNDLLDIFSTETFSIAPGLGFDPVDIVSPLSVSGLTGFITDVNVKVNINHPWINDVVLFLQSPNGDLVELFRQRGGSGDNMVNTVFDDSAAESISTGTAPFTGSFRPEQPLSLFTGLSPNAANGDWLLYVFDLYPGEDEGVLVDWSVEISTGEFATETDQYGFYATDALPADDYNVVLLDSSWKAPAGAATEYPLTITGSGDVNSGSDFAVGKVDRFYGFVFEDANSNGTQQPSELPRGARPIFLDGNNNGVIDGSVTQNFNKNTSLAITDNITVEDTLAVAGVSGAILDIDVRVNLTHTWMEDLQLWLVSPSGQVIQLFNRHGGSGDNMVNTIFDDAAATLISAGTAPFTGRFRPNQALSAINGSNANGNWILRIRDSASGDDGTLTNWSLDIATSPDQVFQTGPDGWLSIDLPSTGTHSLVLTDEGMKFTVPSTGKRAATSGGLPHFNQMFGEREIETLILNSYVMHGGSSTFTGDNRIDTGKSLAKAGPTAQTLSLANMINTTRGINLVSFEVQDLAGTVTAADFVFQMSPQGAFTESANPPTGWAAAPAPTSLVVTPSGINNRVTIAWADRAIENRWLRLSVLANANTGLATTQVFYLGHLRGEVTGAQSGQYIVNNTDASAIAARVSGTNVPVTNIYDLDKNGRVLNADIGAMAPGVGVLRLRNITIPASAARSFGTGSVGGGRSGDGDQTGKGGSLGTAEGESSSTVLNSLDQFFADFSAYGSNTLNDSDDTIRRRRRI